MSHGTLTLRGRVLSGASITQATRLSLDDGNINENYRVTGFEIYPTGDTEPGLWTRTTNQRLHVTLATKPSEVQRFGRSEQIAWMVAFGHTSPSEYRSVIDPGHIIVRDLYISAYEIATNTGGISTTSNNFNYIIHLEKVKSTDDEAVLQLIKERSQDN